MKKPKGSHDKPAPTRNPVPTTSPEPSQTSEAPTPEQTEAVTPEPTATDSPVIGDDLVALASIQRLEQKLWSCHSRTG